MICQFNTYYYYKRTQQLKYSASQISS